MNRELDRYRYPEKTVVMVSEKEDKHYRRTKNKASASIEGRQDNAQFASTVTQATNTAVS